MAVGEIDRVIDTPVEEEAELKFQYPGMPTTCDGAEAVVWVETKVCQGSGAYPITSSTTMGGGFNAAVTNGIPNLWGDQLVFVQQGRQRSRAGHQGTHLAALLFQQLPQLFEFAVLLGDDLLRLADHLLDVHSFVGDLFVSFVEVGLQRGQLVGFRRVQHPVGPVRFGQVGGDRPPRIADLHQGVSLSRAAQLGRGRLASGGGAGPGRDAGIAHHDTVVARRILGGAPRR